MPTPVSTVAVIGAGNMAGAIARALAAADEAPALRLTTRTSRPAWIDELTGVRHTALSDNAAANLDAARDAEVVVLGTKPRDIVDGAREIAPALADGAIVVSVAAGVTIAQLREALPAGVHAVRAMPNTPVAVGRGVTAVATADAPDWVAERVRHVLAPTGLVERIDEAAMDAFGALIGSGPAYVYLLVEAMRDAAVRMGLDADQAGRLLPAMIEGAAVYLAADGRDAAVLRAEVTSPGGSTAEAIRVFEECDLAGMVADALEAARVRNGELGRS